MLINNKQMFVVSESNELLHPALQWYIDDLLSHRCQINDHDAAVLRPVNRCHSVSIVV